MMVLMLAACRGNLPRPDTASRETAPERSSTPEEDNKLNENSALQTHTAAQPGGGAYLEGDGPGTGAPANMASIPDAVPSTEPLHRYANRPYTVLGKNYTPLTSTGNYKERGVASWYGKKFHGQKTSIGEIYDMYGMTAAHTTLPIPSYARVTNLQNNKSVIVRINDRGPFMHERIIDLSYTAAAKLGIIGSGQGMVEVESLTADANAAAPISPIYKEPIQVTPLPSDNSPALSAGGKVFLQLGAFNSQSGAEEFLISMRKKLSDSGKQLSLSHNNGMVKVRIGPYANAETARATALDLQSRLGFKPVVSLY
ncbi:MAG TPA: septal ring lytic transglycosylase RlpA family protein [Gallionellaceae bacterium]|nr:septal ring lytic transglycosylase RlpA family protein [Gallionellaceae bacterium]